ncbi:MAG: dual specificity protein phosphatase family protein [Deltaproteobacteria bacterium]|nr:dual specificity protein phosphatase family protein [Deltaproteobacteria bacterium]
MQHRGFKVLVLAAEEHQPTADHFPAVRVIRFPLDDGPQPWSAQQIMALRRLSGWLAQAVSAGQRVLVTCQMGLNRSGIVTAATVMQLTGAPALDVVEMMRRRRDPYVLCNDAFVEILRTEVASWTATRRPSAAANRAHLRHEVRRGALWGD